MFVGYRLNASKSESVLNGVLKLLLVIFRGELHNLRVRFRLFQLANDLNQTKSCMFWSGLWPATYWDVFLFVGSHSYTIRVLQLSSQFIFFHTQFVFVYGRGIPIYIDMLLIFESVASIGGWIDSAALFNIIWCVCDIDKYCTLYFNMSPRKNKCGVVVWIHEMTASSTKMERLLHFPFCWHGTRHLIL